MSKISKLKIIANLKGEKGHEAHNIYNPQGIAPAVREMHGKVTKIMKQPIEQEISQSNPQMELFECKEEESSVSVSPVKICQSLETEQDLTGRSGLFYEATRIIRDLKSEVFIFENVKGLFSADKGQAFINVLREIADIGLYDCEWQLVNTRWVLPQNRERIYFIGHLRGRSEPKVFPIREDVFADSQIWEGLT